MNQKKKVKILMKKSTFNLLSNNSRIGIRVDSDSLEDTKEVSLDKVYGLFEIKRLTKATSFMVMDEVFYIGKKNPNGKASKIYHVYRVSDKRYVCPSVLDKEETIRLVQRKYVDTMD